MPGPSFIITQTNIDRERICVMITEEKDRSLADRITEALLLLGISPYYKGHGYLVASIEVTVLDPSRIELVTKDLYPSIGRRFEVTTASVERCMRTAISICWFYSKGTLDRMAHRHLTKRPTCSEFIAIIADYIRRTE